MNLTHIIFMTVACAIVMIVWNRTVKKRRAMVAIFFVLPTCGSAFIFANIYQNYQELGIGLVLAYVVYLLWQGFIGHRLPTPSDDNIKVWGQE